MKKKFAVVIVGTQNSGKTTTIRHFDTMYDEWKRGKKQCKAGKRYLVLFKDVLEALYSLIYFVPASPTETGISLSKRLGDWRPEMLLVAEQVDRGESGNKYNETMNFLKTEGYELVEIGIGDNSKEKLWELWDDSKFDSVMKKRAVAIGDLFRGFIKARI